MTDALKLSADTRRETLSQRRILMFWLPLAASWLLMTTEMPFVNAAIARLPDAQTMIAGLGIVASISITIESPVIMLLATATALASHRQAYLTLRRFTIHLMWLTTIVQAWVGFTPLYDVIVRGWMHIPPAVADAAQPGIQILTLWSAAIAWRRFKQGVMIRYGQTRLIGVGTVVRLIASAGTATVLAVSAAQGWISITGVALGGVALMVGVLAEAAYVQWVAAPVINQNLSSTDSPLPVLTYTELVKYHSPLAAVSLLTLLGQPLVGAALARAAHPEPSLAAWPVVYGLLSIFRSGSYALPEAVIALQLGPGTLRPLRRFCYNVGWVTSGLLLLMGMTPLAALYMSGIIGISPDLTALALPGVLLGVALPFISSVQSYLRGVLMGQHETNAVYQAMMINLITLAVGLAVGVRQAWPGVPLAVGALTVSLVTEGAFLAWRVGRRGGR